MTLTVWFPHNVWYMILQKCMNLSMNLFSQREQIIYSIFSCLIQIKWWRNSRKRIRANRILSSDLRYRIFVWRVKQKQTGFWLVHLLLSSNNHQGIRNDWLRNLARRLGQWTNIRVRGNRLKWLPSLKGFDQSLREVLDDLPFRSFIQEEGASPRTIRSNERGIRQPSLEVVYIYLFSPSWRRCTWWWDHWGKSIRVLVPPECYNITYPWN